MRYLLVLATAYLFTACAAEYAVEDQAGAQGTFAVSGQGETLGQYPLTNPDSVPIPEAGFNDSLGGSGANAPTPYGLTIREEGDAYAGSKGGTTGPASAPALAAQQLLAGRWISTDDAQEQVELTPTHYKTYYEGELLVEENMVFHNVCPGACSGGSSTGEPCFTISGAAQTDCYGIVRLDEEVLELQLLGVSNETIVYRRAD
ncbi:hypothetical protein LEM8419_01367 [Neolewinella maritima]|uniref:Uncharacterized protein n=1 Tax=Neolewinella maritima TaxID=1383882 RepID=A0ABN8F7W3_9BACT|nr:hypothetical protein [Neolewinella maritima]CAH1000219.1 hypothetical protein LEM8419_01367 [Neolewinella maritima]